MPFGFSLIPREKRFFDMFDETTAHLVKAAGKFLDMVTVFDNLTDRSQEMKIEEEALDDLVRRIIEPDHVGKQVDIRRIRRAVHEREAKGALREVATAVVRFLQDLGERGLRRLVALVRRVRCGRRRSVPPGERPGGGPRARSPHRRQNAGG